MPIQRLMWVAWPAFLAACMLELAVFAVVDPLDLHWGAEPLGWSRQSVYAAGFFVFWIVNAAACVLTTFLRMTTAQVNDCPYQPDERPTGCPGR